MPDTIHLYVSNTLNSPWYTVSPWSTLARWKKHMNSVLNASRRKTKAKVMIRTLSPHPKKEEEVSVMKWLLYSLLPLDSEAEAQFSMMLVIAYVAFGM